MTTTRRAAPARSAAPARPLPPLGTLALMVLIGASVVLGLLALIFKLYVPALMFWTISAGLTLGRQMAEQSRLANARFDEMTRELRLIRLSLTSGTPAPGTHDLGQAAPEPWAPAAAVPGVIPGTAAVPAHPQGAVHPHGSGAPTR